MPRGNDTEHAQAFDQAALDQYGIHANAEDMIRAHTAAIDPALTKASLLQANADATEEAKGDLKAAGKKLGVGKDETLLDVTVRGNALIGVVENEHGVTRKVVSGWNEDYVPPKLTAEQAEAKAVADRDRAVAEEAASLRAEMDQKLADLSAKLEEENAKKLEKAVEDAEKRLEKAHDAAQKEAEKTSDSDKGGGATKGSSQSSRSASEKKNETKGS